MNKISPRNREIYQLSKERPDLSQKQIGQLIDPPMTRQRVSKVLQQVRAVLGEEQPQRQAAAFPILKGNINLSERHAACLAELEQESYSAKMRFLIEVYGINSHRYETIINIEGPAPIKKGGFYINAEQQSILDSVPEKNYSRTMRHIIEFYLIHK